MYDIDYSSRLQGMWTVESDVLTCGR